MCIFRGAADRLAIVQYGQRNFVRTLDQQTGGKVHISVQHGPVTSMRKIFLELPGKARHDQPELGDEYTITVTRPDGLACTDDEARLILVECLRQGPRRRRKVKGSEQQQLEARGQMRLMD